MSVAVVTDSTCDIPTEMCDRFGITVIPLNVEIMGETYLDGVFTQSEYFERMARAAVLPKTSQPSVGTFVELYRAALERANHVVSIHISSHISGTYDAAIQAAKTFAGKVHVVDSLSLSWGLAFPVIDAAKAAADGASVDDVLRCAREVRSRVRIMAGFDSMDNLVKGGRIGRLTGFVGSVLNIRVLIDVIDGKFVPAARAHGSNAALDKTMHWIDKQMGDCRRGRFCVVHAMAEERALILKSRILERFEASEIHVMEVGTVLSTHTGVGWGVALIPES